MKYFFKNMTTEDLGINIQESNGETYIRIDFERGGVYTKLRKRYNERDSLLRFKEVKSN